ncbi:MAG: hypothetical protein WC548_02450 [Candidatus Pacearchaeota archaeon]
MTKNFVWQFTNQKKLNKKEFEDYFERKIFKTIRKYSMLPDNRVIKIKKSNNINAKILIYVLKQKFSVRFSESPNFFSENLSQIAEDIFKNILKGKFISEKINAPLRFLSDKEIELYAKLKNIKGVKRKKDEKIQLLFNKFFSKNPDLEINIVKAMEQIK